MSRIFSFESLGVLRILAAAPVIIHGITGLAAHFIPIQWYPVPATPFTIAFYWFELAGGLMVLIGYCSRIAALFLGIAFAALSLTRGPAPDLWPIEHDLLLNVLLTYPFLVVAMLGPGAWAVEAD